MSEEPQEFSQAISQWEVSPEQPIAPIRCVTVHKDGTRCEYAAIPGANRCLKHGAEETESHKVVEAARKRLQGLTHTAIETFDDVMRNSINDSARIKAASEVLNRVGVKETTEINVQIEDKSEARKAVLDRINNLRLEDTEDIEDAEVVEDDE